MCILFIRTFPCDLQHMRCTATDKCNTYLSNPGLTEYDCPHAMPVFVEKVADGPCPVCETRRREEFDRMFSRDNDEGSEVDEEAIREELERGMFVKEGRSWSSIPTNELGAVLASPSPHAGKSDESATVVAPSSTATYDDAPPPSWVQEYVIQKAQMEIEAEARQLEGRETTAPSLASNTLEHLQAETREWCRLSG